MVEFLKKDSKDKPIHHVTLGDLRLEQENNTLISYDEFPNQHIYVLVEFETDGVHYGTSVDLHPYNGSICLSSYIIGSTIYTGYIDEEGHIVLTIPSGMNLTNIEAHYYIYG